MGGWMLFCGTCNWKMPGLIWTSYGLNMGQDVDGVIVKPENLFF